MTKSIDHPEQTNKDGNPILDVRDVVVEFSSGSGKIRALDGVSLSVLPGEIVAVVGESGCGKTTLARAILGLQPLAQGSITLEGQPVRGIVRSIAEKVGMVWQDPYASLNPRWSVAKSIQEPAVLAGKPADTDAIFTEVGLSLSFRNRYPHELSGGQRQRVAIGRALSLRPPLVICDEPTAALDLSVRAQILNLLKDLRDLHESAFLYISHDLTTVRFLADRIAVMYMGRIVESGPVEEIFQSSRHPYTAALLRSAPSLDRLLQLPQAPDGEIPDPHLRLVGCRYAGRCDRASETCRRVDPMIGGTATHAYFCHHPLDLE